MLIKNLFKRNWFAILYFNFKMLPFRQAVGFPFDFYGKIKFQSLKGKVIINTTVSRGCFQFGFAQGALFANISSAPFIMQGHYGFSPMLFSACFGINALAIVIFAALSVKFRTMEKALMTGSVGMLVFSAFLCAVLCLDGGFWAYETMLVGLLASLGLTFTASNTLAMDAGRECAGTASALLGAAGFIFGGAVSVLAGIGNVMVSAGILFFVCSACALVCTLTAGENPRFYLKKALLIGRQ